MRSRARQKIETGPFLWHIRFYDHRDAILDFNKPEIIFPLHLYPPHKKDHKNCVVAESNKQASEKKEKILRARKNSFHIFYCRHESFPTTHRIAALKCAKGEKNDFAVVKDGNE